jgi:flagellar motor switch protein FliM
MADSEVLSQDEIDALLSHVDSGDADVGADDSVDPASTRAYDFTSQDRLISGRMPTLEMINELFARNLRASLFDLIRCSPEVSAEGVKLIKYGEYAQSLPAPSSLNIVRLNPLQGDALIIFNPKLVYSLVDCFFGGDGGSEVKPDAREFTAAEMRIIRKTLDLILVDLKGAWHSVLPVELEYVSSETNPQFLHVVSQSEVVVVSTFHIGLDAGAGYLHIAIPYSTVEPIKGLLGEGAYGDGNGTDPRWSSSLADELMYASVELSSTLATAEVSVDDLRHFEVGDVLTLELPEKVVATVDEVPVFRAKYGVSRGNFALKVVELVKHGDLTPRNVETGVENE